MFDTSAFLQGLALGLGLFAVPGPKDILIARQALLRRPAPALILVGSVSDACLIALGMTGASAALARAPTWQTAALWLSVFLLLLHAVQAARRAAGGSATPIGPAEQAPHRGADMRALLTVSFFNPLAWLDTVLVLGTMGAALPPPRQPGVAGGAVAAAQAGVTARGGGARPGGRWGALPQAWRIVEGCVAAAMAGLAAHVLRGLL